MIAVTGANGLLGTFIIRQLVSEQRPCAAIVREGSDLSLLNDVKDKIEIRYADVRNSLQVDEALNGVTKVVHAAATVSFNPRRRQEILDNNISGTRNIVNACLARDVKRLVHISSVAALGRQKGQTVVDESNKWIDSPLNSTYAESKYFSELEVFRGQEEGLSTVVINPSVILATANWEKSSAKLFNYVWREKKFYIDSYLNYVDVRDVAAITIRLMDLPIEADRFVVNAGTIPFHDFFKKVAQRFGAKPPSILLDRTFLRVAAVAESLRSNLTGTEPLITRETALLSGTHFTYDSKKIKTTLGFDFQTVDATLDWCCAYYLNYIHKK
jgi:dihydroflavonol-4-reductase